MAAQPEERPRAASPSPAGSPFASLPAPRAVLPFRLFAALLVAAVAALGLLIYGPTLGSSWAYDDMDFFNMTGDVLAGKRGFWPTLIHPHAEHVVPLLRLAFHASLSLFGVDALPFRLVLLAAYLSAAWWLGLVARRYGGDAAGLAAGLCYVAAAGFSSMYVWFPSSAHVTFGIAALTAALAALAYRERLGVRRARLLAGAGVLLMLLSENTLAPLVAGPILLDEIERRREGARRPVGLFAVLCAVAAVAVLLVSSWLYTRTYGPHVSISIRHGVPRAAFLLLAASFRLLFPGVQVLASEPGLKTGLLGCRLGLAVALPAAALLLALWRRGLPRLAVVAALCAVGPLGVVGLIGLGRWRTSYYELYQADRYFFTLMIPIALAAGAVAATAAERLREWPRRARAALLLILLLAFGTELVLHRRAALNRIPFDIYAAHGVRLGELELLADRLEEAARALPPGAPPLELPDADLWFPEVHNGRISARVLLHVVSDGAGGRLRLGGPTVSERDARILDPVLERWARDVGEPLPYLSIVEGRLVDAHVISFADFRTGPQDRAVVSGFHHWEGTSRWMGSRGELRLTLLKPGLIFHLAAPTETLRRTDPALAEIAVDVTAVDEALGFSVPLGTLRVAGEGVGIYRLDATPFLSRIGAGRTIHLVLQSERTWRPAGTLPGSADTRDLSVQVFAAGCE